jgi:hypothetical protein
VYTKLRNTHRFAIQAKVGQQFRLGRDDRHDPAGRCLQLDSIAGLVSTGDHGWVQPKVKKSPHREAGTNIFVRSQSFRV